MSDESQMLQAIALQGNIFFIIINYCNGSILSHYKIQTDLIFIFFLWRTNIYYNLQTKRIFISRQVKALANVMRIVAGIYGLFE
jgi:hypothetical protein